MFSKRSFFPSESNPLYRRLHEMEASGEKVLNMARSNPTECGILAPMDMIGELSSAENRNYRPEPFGQLEARRAVSLYYEERGCAVPPSDIVLCASTSEAYSFLFQLLCDPGDRVLIHQPGYPLFDYLAALSHVKLTSFDFEYFHPGGWCVDRTSFEQSLQAGDVKAVVLVHPGNPTGAYIRPDDRSYLLEMANRYGFALIVDEVFLDFPLADSEGAVSFAGDDAAPCVVLSGISKILALPQMKLGWLVCRGPETFRKEALKRLEIIADTYLSVNTPVQNAFPRWMEKLSLIQRPILERAKQNLAFLEAAFQGTPLRVLKTEGGWNAVVELPRFLSEEEWGMGLLNEEKVFAYPGYFFEFRREAFLNLSLILPEPDFRQGVERILKFCARIEKKS